MEGKPHEPAGSQGSDGSKDNGPSVPPTPDARQRTSSRYRKSSRTQSPPASIIPVPIEISRFWKNRRHDLVVVQLKEFEGHALIDVRQFFTSPDGKLRPTKRGLALSISRLPELVGAVTKALSIARELKLLAGAAP